MKRLRVLFPILLSSLVYSTQVYADLQAYKIAPCRSWMPTQTGGFVCQSMFSPILVPQAESFAAAVKAQEARILELEKKIAEIEDSCKKP